MSLLNNIFVQDPNPSWIKINNVGIGESHKYGYKVYTNLNIGDLLTTVSKDSNVVCVVYQWSTGIAYTKSGFNLSLNGDVSSAPGYTTFVLKSKISKFYNGNIVPVVPIVPVTTTTNIISPYSMNSGMIQSALSSVTSFKPSFTFCFWNANGWDCGDPSTSDLSSVVNNGGKIMISFGGAAGCASQTGINNSGGELGLQGYSAQQLMQSYLKPIQQYNFTYADFDIEAGIEMDSSTYSVRNDALVLLQQQMPSLKISFTVAGNLGAQPMIQDAINKGLKIDCLRLMLMDYMVQVDLVSTCIQNLQQAHTMFPNLNLGFIPLLGLDDQSINTYTLANHQQIISQIKSNNMSYVNTFSYWELHGDPNFEYLQAYSVVA